VKLIDERFYPNEHRDWDERRFCTLIRQYLEPQFVVLDYGAGRGKSDLFDFRHSVARHVGVDIDDVVLGNPLLDEARLVGPDGRLPFNDEEFDLTYCSSVLEHLENPAQTFAELDRVLKPGGLALAKTPNRRHYVAMVARLTPTSFHRWVNKRRGRAECDTFPTHYRCNTKAHLEKALKGTSLEIESLHFWEGRPEYLRLSPITYAAGIAYEKIVNSGRALAALRAVMVAVLRKKAKH
jgi:SAM-dependent methyltransferase